MTVPSVWNDDLLSAQLDLRHFRGENQYMWHYREWPRAMQLKYFVLTEYVRRRDPRGLLERLGEDGAFGCWTFEYPGLPRVSRDLLDSVNEINFLERHLGILDRPSLRVLDIGAGYGRTAYRMVDAAAGIDDYCCVDAVPESTFISEYYLRHRGRRRHRPASCRCTSSTTRREPGTTTWRSTSTASRNAATRRSPGGSTGSHDSRCPTS